MMLATLWPATVKFFTDNPIARFILWLFLFIIGWTLLKNHLKQAGAEAERAAIAKKQAQVREAVIERKDEIISEEEAHADQAIAARDREYPATDFDSLPDAEKRILDRRFRGGQTPQ